jgi:hypothetical protein
MHKSISLLGISIPLFLALLLAGCGGNGDGNASASGTTSASSYDGTFTATVGDRSYDVPVNCSGLGEDDFEFRSDRSDASDTNGDGYVVSGMQNGEKFILTVMDHDTTWSTPNLSEWTVDGTTVEGAGPLYEDGGDNRTRSVSFTANCE